MVINFLLALSNIGSVAISDSILIHNVLYVPKFQFNLLSLSKFTKSHNCCVAFYPHRRVFQDLKNGKIIWIGRERHGLYHLSTAVPQSSFLPAVHHISPSVPQCKSFTSCNSVNNIMWHQRLGHMSISRMHMLPFISKHFHLNHCDICPKSKQTRLSFPKASLSKTSSLFELVHVDI